jgi:acyl carrier protein
MLQVDIQTAVEKAIRDVADEWDLELPPLRPDSELVDELGFSSMTVVSLTMNLEEELGVDPFADRSVMLTDMRTIQDLCDVYGRALGAADPASAASI